jgi:hypothetical protein
MLTHLAVIVGGNQPEVSVSSLVRDAICWYDSIDESDVPAEALGYDEPQRVGRRGRRTQFPASVTVRLDAASEDALSRLVAGGRPQAEVVREAVGYFVADRARQGSRRP